MYFPLRLVRLDGITQIACADRVSGGARDPGPDFQHMSVSVDGWFHHYESRPNVKGGPRDQIQTGFSNILKP